MSRSVLTDVLAVEFILGTVEQGGGNVEDGGTELRVARG
jgi:hypothetical protein